jgi:hypothetical protein
MALLMLPNLRQESLEGCRCDICHSYYVFLRQTSVKHCFKNFTAARHDVFVCTKFLENLKNPENRSIIVKIHRYEKVMNFFTKTIMSYVCIMKFKLLLKRNLMIFSGQVPGQYFYRPSNETWLLLNVLHTLHQ